MLKKDNLDIQQLTLRPIMDDEVFPELLATINDAILAAYSKNEKKTRNSERIEHQLMNIEFFFIGIKTN